MEWIVIGGILVFVMVVGVQAELKKQKEQKEKAEQYNSLINFERQALLSAPDRMTLQPLDPGDYRYRPVGKENLIAIQENASAFELKSSGNYRTSGASISIPIVKGVRYRVGAGRIASEKSWQVTATGRLLITDKAVVFESPEKNDRITWGQIADVELMVDGFRIAKRTGSPKTFVVNSPDPKFAAVLELMLMRVD
ncbi:hypothetical protein OIU34_24835 [Pararhizobium sp. BT-229]|uniref:hypothetical protein n=1 Tax=Pararhizobium sp. BT-229 TaxID=2986923 RepID=UPI0021F7A0D3|nr:hypothetical protein [Pararhizobium sp. BT-229]MCV9965112.1 hypothetical protein [Pararhizobium sp. BT-229]